MSVYKYYDLIKKPIITEKTTSISEQNKYTFYVNKFAKKLTIKKAIEAIFKVKVKKVNILNIQGKKKRFKGIIGTQINQKKAIVTLEKDHNIDYAGGIK
ncbi:50S ribosomal protein L23 [Rickettsia typhi]|uniref:Large ribosomal subunit protein uL23 n=2 Tax=Rickettsia typhi TaxID=785 RepID=RL23_RICTY|nr:50S ribosomal protein L23 [Rickettsia typhi]Q68W80.1 RecName: Full=Large ribosomal subunit protein uL23; AltName: Full=50S ribosomal protein L23 [Rickettsia typhi str. Wilmington]AAU04112.1 50S ribosomal protein L23 [Rickettsia typhi str. Wilmington]AFE54491.1 50S ribosomal protein L23 [Rickettsia typhi str. TH1527]AFE55330.1 50S ribosomal protein L23 [Rickettsia typhi str. B9991CWPP]